MGVCAGERSETSPHTHTHANTYLTGFPKQLPYDPNPAGKNKRSRSSGIYTDTTFTSNPIHLIQEFPGRRVFYFFCSKAVLGCSRSGPWCGRVSVCVHVGCACVQTRFSDILHPWPELADLSSNGDDLRPEIKRRVAFKQAFCQN